MFGFGSCLASGFSLTYCLLAFTAVGCFASTTPIPVDGLSGKTTDGLDGNLVYLDNGVIRVGIDLSRGGSIAYLSTSRGATAATNVINAHDMGREVQLSFYSGPAFYNPNGRCNKLFHGREWPWNPIGAGDIKGHHGKILHHSGNRTHLHVVTRPLQWACDNVPCDCVFDQMISLEGNPGNTGVRVEAVLRNNRTDHTPYQAQDQELPAVYSNAPYYRLVTFQGGHQKVFDTGFSSQTNFWTPGRFSADENWAAMMNKDLTFGMGVVNYNTTTFVGGFSGQKGHGGSTDPSTGYVSPVAKASLPWNAQFSFTFHLVLGDLNTIRSYAHQARPHV
jgi:hypothetical protein